MKTRMILNQNGMKRSIIDQIFYFVKIAERFTAGIYSAPPALHPPISRDAPINRIFRFSEECLDAAGESLISYCESLADVLIEYEPVARRRVTEFKQTLQEINQFQAEVKQFSVTM